MSYFKIYFLGTGGGSGGSVWITTGYLRGHGAVSSLGGTGSVYGALRGGSGSGGRIAVHISIKDEYKGGFHALGGVGTGSQHGGSGTVYVEEAIDQKLSRRLYIDNMNANPSKVFVLDHRNPKTIARGEKEENFADYGFDELMLQRQVLNGVYICQKHTCNKQRYFQTISGFKIRILTNVFSEVKSENNNKQK
jgi:hypothetical protein